MTIDHSTIAEIIKLSEGQLDALRAWGKIMSEMRISNG